MIASAGSRHASRCSRRRTSAILQDLPLLLYRCTSPLGKSYWYKYNEQYCTR